MNDDRKIDVIFKLANDMFYADKFDEYQAILDDLNLNELSTTIIVAYLVTSHWARPKLPNRYKFVDRVIEILKKKAPERWEKMVVGLT